MAWKENTFWDEHAQTYPLPAWWGGEPRPQEGLRVKPQRSASNLSGLQVVSFTWLIGYGICQLLPHAIEAYWKVVSPVFYPTAMLALILLVGLVSARYSRFYLFDAVTGRFVSRKHFHRYDLLVCVASDPVLLEHLGEPRWRRDCPGLAWSLPCGRLLIGISTFIWVFFLSLPLFFRVGIVWWITAAVITGTVFVMVVMYRRAAPSRPSNRFEDWSLPPEDSPSIPFDRVKSAILHWDRLLQREYLLLEYDGGQLRYYNFTGDPLYLLRQWKQRMAGSGLRVSDERG